MPTFCITVSGRVQGVGFRAFVQTLAKKRGISGEVWNTAGGQVSLVAEHADVQVLRQFADELRQGPGSPEHVQCVEAPPWGQTGFIIGSTRP